MLSARADDGAAVRILIGDPRSEAVDRRGAEEGIDMAGRCRMTLGLLEPLLGHPGVDVRLHDTTLYVSLYRGDDVLLANTHFYGSAAACSAELSRPVDRRVTRRERHLLFRRVVRRACRSGTVRRRGRGRRGGVR
jgi:hypothetical protein